MYGAFIERRVQNSNGMLEVEVLEKVYKDFFYDSLRQSCWQCATSAWKNSLDACSNKIQKMHFESVIKHTQKPQDIIISKVVCAS